MQLKRILVIDDSEVMLTRIDAALTRAGFAVTTSSQSVGNARYLAACELVILDYHMPGIDGESVAASLRAARGARNCPLFLYTSDDKAVANHVELGFDGVFKGKGDEEALVRQVNALFRVLDIRAEKARKGG